jgi:nitrate/nitrite transporter NarK
MVAMGLASLTSDLTLPILWEACIEMGGSYTATLAATMNMVGNFAGFVAPVVGGVILQRTGGNWNVLIDTMVAAATVSGLSWLYLDPDSERRKQELELKKAGAMSPDRLAP